MSVKKLLLGVTILCVILTSCSDDYAIDVQERKSQSKEVQVAASGIKFKDKSSDVIGMGLTGSGSITNDDLYDIIDTWTYYDDSNVKDVDVYIDMSNGVNQGIEQSQSHMESLTLTLKNNATYYKIGGSDNDEGEYNPELLDIDDYTKAYSTFTDRSRFNDGRSKLRAGLEACINNTDNISVFVTDFLLDEGVRKKPQSLHSSIKRRIAEDGTPWAITEFSNWFKGNNLLEIIAVEHTLSKGYGCINDNGCKKQIYYLFFTPAQLEGVNKEVEDMISEMKGMDNTNYLKINPLAIACVNNAVDGVGDVNYDYPSSKIHTPIVIDNYQLQFIPVNIPMMKKRIEDAENFTVFNDITLVNNLSMNDSRNDKSSPYSINLEGSFYDATEFYYQLCSIDKTKLPISNMQFSTDNYPGNLKDQGDGNVKLVNAREIIERNNLFTFNTDDLTIGLQSIALQNQSYFAEDANHAKLYLCDLSVKDVSFSAYNEDYLMWKFYARDGYLNNLGLKESINKALQTNKNNYRGKVIYSYLIGLNDNK